MLLFLDQGKVEANIMLAFVQKNVLLSPLQMITLGLIQDFFKITMYYDNIYSAENIFIKN